VKRRILSQYPDWKETFIYLRETASQEVSCEETESEEASNGPTSPPDSQEIEVIVLEEGTREEVVALPPNIVIAYSLQVVPLPHEVPGYSYRYY